MATPLAKASDEAIEHRFVGSLRFDCALSGHGGLAGEDELRDVGKSDGVAAGDALASELPDEIAEEEIDLVRGACRTHSAMDTCSRLAMGMSLSDSS